MRRFTMFALILGGVVLILGLTVWAQGTGLPFRELMDPNMPPGMSMPTSQPASATMDPNMPGMDPNMPGMDMGSPPASTAGPGE